MLCCGIGQTTDIKILEDGLRVTLPVIRNKININLFKLDDNILSCIFESAHACRRLQLVNCKIEVTKQFKVNTSIEFLIEELDLRLTCMTNCEDRLNKKNLGIFLRKLGKTTLKHSLKTIRVHYDQWDVWLVKDALKAHGFVNTSLINEWIYGDRK